MMNRDHLSLETRAHLTSDTSALSEWNKKHDERHQGAPTPNRFSLSSVALRSAIICSVALPLTMNLGEDVSNIREDILNNKEVISEATASLTNKHELNHEMSRIASNLAGSPFLVNCDDGPLKRFDEYHHIEESGREYSAEAFARRVILHDGTSFSPPITTMREGLCETIANYDPALPSNPSDAEAFNTLYDETYRYTWGIKVLLHEIEHTNEVHDESEANCYAVQKLPPALEELGVDKMYIDIMPYTLAHVAAQYSQSSYLSEECRPGGAFDLNISDAYLLKPQNENEKPRLALYTPDQP